MFEINERGTYADPSTLDDDQRAAQDEELFQTARLCNVGWFGSVVFSDYFSSILGLVRTGSSWSLNPFGVCISIVDGSKFGGLFSCDRRKFVKKITHCSSVDVEILAQLR
jgi:hypothetical protein